LQLKKESLNNPKISIITICFNSQETIEDTLRSVHEQSYQNIEHVIVDGASTDATMEIVKKYQTDKMVLISEKDHGLYDALNKGFKLATGDVIGVLHSDDFLANANSIRDLAQIFNQNPNCDAVSASVDIFKPNQMNQAYRKYNASKFKLWQFRIGNQPPHPGFYIKKKAFDQIGYFNSSYKISGDFDWLLRGLLKEKIKVVFSELVLVHMRDGGISSSGVKSKKIMNKENLRVLKSHGIYSNSIMIYCKYFLKIFQLRF
jgi:glycosyltransferase involved in cell wall biosynthesis